VQDHYNERLIINKFNTMQDSLIGSITEMIFKKPLPDYNQNRPIGLYFENKTFMDLDMQGIIN
jgi:hypothetical protein